MALKKKKFYAVAKGRRPGIYTEWFGPGGAHEQVKNFTDAVYKGFFTRSEAEAFCKNPPVRRWKKTGTGKTSAARVNASPRPGDIVMYTDGCALNNPGPGGYGSVILDGEQRREISDGFKKTTNNRMELLACIRGLESLDRPSRVTLYSDSKYVVDGITKGWAGRWKKNGWMRTKTEPAVNPDLWDRLLELCEKHDVSFVWVKGHAGNPENERCDRLANMAAMRGGLPADKGYKG